MTRKEEIRHKAGSITDGMKQHYVSQNECRGYYEGFIDGAQWADKTMIEKACQWIETYLFDIGFPDDWCRDSATMKSGKQRFIEAMEE